MPSAACRAIMNSGQPLTAGKDVLAAGQLRRPPAQEPVPGPAHVVAQKAVFDAGPAAVAGRPNRRCPLVGRHGDALHRAVMAGALERQLDRLPGQRQQFLVARAPGIEGHAIRRPQRIEPCRKVDRGPGPSPTNRLHAAAGRAVGKRHSEPSPGRFLLPDGLSPLVPERQPAELGGHARLLGGGRRLLGPAEMAPVPPHRLPIRLAWLGRGREQNIVGVFHRRVGVPRSGRIGRVDRVPREPGRQETDGKLRPAGHVQIQRVVAAFQLTAMQDREVGNDAQGHAAVLHENERGLVLGIRHEAPDRRRKRPFGTMRKPQPVEQLMQRRAARRLEAGHHANPRAVSVDHQMADDAVGADRELFDERAAFQRNGRRFARQGRRCTGRDHGNRAFGLSTAAGGHLDPPVAVAGQVAFLHGAVFHCGFDGDVFAPQHDRRPRLGTGRGEQGPGLGEDRHGSKQQGKRNDRTMACHGSRLPLIPGHFETVQVRSRSKVNAAVQVVSAGRDRYRRVGQHVDLPALGLDPRDGAVEQRVNLAL